MNSIANKLPFHLGGHKGRTHVDEGVLEYFKTQHGCQTLVDIGCGPGGQILAAQRLGYKTLGIDGDYTLTYTTEVLIHDYTSSSLKLANPYDLGWCVEFLEHVEEQFIPNYMETMKSCKWLVVTHALPGKPGHHHVNCQEHYYWIDNFAKFNFVFDQIVTDDVRKYSTMQRNFIRENALVFRNAST